MIIIKNVDLSDIITSLATSVKTANEILSADPAHPTMISEFFVELSLSATFDSKSIFPPTQERAITSAALEKYKGIKLNSVFQLDVPERITSQYNEQFGLNIKATINPIPALQKS